MAVTVNSDDLNSKVHIVEHDIVDEFATPEVSKRIYEHTMRALELNRAANAGGGAVIQALIML